MFTTFSPLPSPMINNNINQEVPKHSLPPLSQIITSMPSYQATYQLPLHQHHQYSPQQAQPLQPHPQVAYQQPEPIKKEDFSPTIIPQQSELKVQQPNPVSPKYSSKVVVDKCTCRNEGNHIPRPRNAFILFRQQHHQSVLDEGNVIRTNPDVSRELGKRWRDLSPEEKVYWNKLAEEEKKRHAEKYPGYRYIPRRFGKKGSCPFCKNKQPNQAQQQPTPPTSSSTTPEDAGKATNSSSEDHAIAQSFLSLRNQQPHPSYKPGYFQETHQQPQQHQQFHPHHQVQFSAIPFQSPVYHQHPISQQQQQQQPVAVAQSRSQHGSNYTVTASGAPSRSPTEIRGSLESPDDKAKVCSFANILN